MAGVADGAGAEQHTIVQSNAQHDSQRTNAPERSKFAVVARALTAVIYTTKMGNSARLSGPLS